MSRIDYEAMYEAYLDQIAAEPKIYWHEGDPLPPWHARNKRERNMMIDWVNYQLNQLPDGLENWKPNPPDVAKRQLDWILNLGPEIEFAEHGDIEPLRRKLPHLAKFLCLPKMDGKGRRFQKNPRKFKKKKAAAVTVRKIMALWKEHYGRKNRSPSDGPSAAEIAAERWGVDVEAVLRELKKIPAK